MPVNDCLYVFTGGDLDQFTGEAIVDRRSLRHLYHFPTRVYICSDKYRDIWRWAYSVEPSVCVCGELLGVLGRDF